MFLEVKFFTVSVLLPQVYESFENFVSLFYAIYIQLNETKCETNPNCFPKKDLLYLIVTFEATAWLCGTLNISLNISVVLVKGLTGIFDSEATLLYTGFYLRPFIILIMLFKVLE